MRRAPGVSVVFAALVVFAGAAAALALPGGFKPGDRVEAYSSMTGTWEPATIQSIDGDRYFVHATDPHIANAYWGAAPSQVRAPGSAPAAAAPPQAGAAAAAMPEPARPGAVAVAPRGPKRPEGSAEHVLGADGRTHLRALAGPGDEMPLGRWKLSAGGQSVLTGRTNNGDGTGTVTHQWAGPESAGSLTINPNGTWLDVSASGIRTQGRWKDLGQNRVELDGYDGEVWTASTWHGDLNMVNAVGEYEYGRRQ